MYKNHETTENWSLACSSQHSPAGRSFLRTVGSARAAARFFWTPLDGRAGSCPPVWTRRGGKLGRWAPPPCAAARLRELRSDRPPRLKNRLLLFLHERTKGGKNAAVAWRGLSAEGGLSGRHEVARSTAAWISSLFSGSPAGAGSSRRYLKPVRYVRTAPGRFGGSGRTQQSVRELRCGGKRASQLQH